VAAGDMAAAKENKASWHAISGGHVAGAVYENGSGKQQRHGVAT